MHSTAILGLAMVTLSLAQTSTVSLYIPDADTQSLVASIVGSDATATTYAFQCAPGTDSDDCGFPGTYTLTEGPSTAVYTFPAEMDENGTVAFTGYYDCSLAPSSAVCVESFGGTEANFPGMSTETYSGTDYTSMPVVITAGAVVASNTGSSVPASTTTSGSSQATNTSTSGGTAKTSGISSGGVTAQTSGTSKPSGTSTSTAAGAAITGCSAWMLGGAALALAAMA
ncbi:hypothetical protein EG329_004805 [Mollisiaceae sp. DMI_Dod_QoI]|nr:hypothetical protein EG329_004805 [Helotiales sp. DMI_Dod_QoI]